MSKEKNVTQITRIDGKNVFVEVMNNAFGIGKVLLNFAEYDPKQGNKQTKLIPIYMNLEEFLIFAQDVKSGRVAMYQKQHENDQYPYAVKEYELLGGTSAESLAKAGKSRKDGKSVSRQFKLVVGKKFILQAEMGPGHVNETGLIVPDYNTKSAEMVVKVPMDAKALKGMVLIVEQHLNAYLAREYAKGSFDYKPKTA